MNKQTRDNRGIALISVLITITLCFLLSGAIMQVSYLALLSRNVSTASANNFYDAESVVDNMKVELQKIAAASLNVSGTKDPSAYLDSLAVYLVGTKDFATTTDTMRQHVADILKQNALSGAVVTVTGDIERTDDYLVIRGVTVQYTDSNGYYSEITTDIKLMAPYYASSESNALGTYSMMAGGGFSVKTNSNWNNQDPGYFVQEGNVYIGMQNNSDASDQTAIDVAQYATLILDGDNVVVNGNIKLDKNAVIGFTGRVVEVRGTIFMDKDAFLLLGAKTYLLCKDIIIGGESVSGAGGYTKYSNAASVPISRYFPYSQDFDPINTTSTKDGGMSSTVAGAKGGMYVFDESQQKYYLIQTGSGTPESPRFFYSYDVAGVGTVTKEYKCFSDGTAEKAQGLYFDGAILPKPRVTYNVYLNGTKQDVTVDPYFASVVNVPMLYYIRNINGDERTQKYYAVNGSTEVKSQETKMGIGSASYFELNAPYVIDPLTDTIKAQNKLTYHDTKYGVQEYYPYMEIGKMQDNLNCTPMRKNGSSGAMSFYCGTNTYTVTGNWEGYLGIFMSAEKVIYNMQTGGGYGISILNSESAFKDENKGYLKTFMDTAGNWMTVANPQNFCENHGYKDGSGVKYEYTYPFLLNNLIVGGMKSFYESEDDSSVTIDKSQNENLNLIELENWNKR